MKIATIIGMFALAGATALGCSGTSAQSGDGNESTGDDSGASSSGASSSGASSSGASSSGASSSGASSSGASSSGASSSGASSGAGGDAGGGLVTSKDAGATSDEIDSAETKTITMDSFVVAANTEVYYCQNFANPWGASVDIKTYSLDMSTGSHHMFAFYLNNATDGAVTQCPNGGLTFGAFTFTSQSPTLVQTYPATVGATLPKTTGFQMMVHYLNTGSTPITAHVSLTMSVAKPNVVTNHAGVLFLNNLLVTAPPNKVQVSSSSYSLTQNINILSTDSHMHNQATNFVATAGNQTLFTTKEWSEPVAKVFATPLAVSQNTIISWSCTYDNTLQPTKTLTFGESALNNVMCISTSIFYPVSDVTNPVLPANALQGFAGM
jgi:hypothetical protein